MISLAVRVINPSRRWLCRRSRRLPGEDGQGSEQQQMDGTSSSVAQEEEGEPGGEEEQGHGGARRWTEMGKH